MGAYTIKRLFYQGENKCSGRSRKKKLRKRNETGKIVGGKELKREKNNVGGEGVGGPVYLCYVLFPR